MRLIRTQTLEELLSAKHAFPDARCIAGGTDLLVQAYEKGTFPDTLLDVSRNRDLTRIDLADGRLSIGAAVTFDQLETSLLIRRTAPILAEAAAQVGSPQIRNRGTLGGNVANASPAADSLAPLSVYDCGAVLVNAKSGARRELPLNRMITGPGRTAMEQDEVLEKLLLTPMTAGSAWAYRKIGRRNALAIARMSGAVTMARSGGNAWKIALSIGSVLPAPERLPFAEAILARDPSSESCVREAGEAVRAFVLEKTGGRASAAYKMSVIPDLIAALIREAMERTGD